MRGKNFFMKKWIAAFMLLWICVFVILVFNEYPTSSTDGISAADTAWMMLSAAFVLLMTPGLSFFYGGMVNKKNVLSTMLQSFIALGVVSVVWVFVGFSLAFGESIHGIVGNPMTYFAFNGVGLSSNEAFSSTIPFMLFALFQLKFAVITPALITGSFAERVKFSAYLIFMILFVLLVYCPLAHMTWHPDGILRKLGVLDFAGGTVVHMSAGFAALAGAYYLGKRKNITHDPANIPFIIIGTGLLWFGWFGFNGGSALAADGLAVLAFANTNFASAAAMLSWVLLDKVRGKKISAMGACIAAIVGLVAITPAAGFVTVMQSIFIGAFAAVVSNLAIAVQNKNRIDDTLDVFASHGVGGMVGMLLTGIFAHEVGLIYGETHTFMYHVITLIAVGISVFFLSLILYRITDLITPLRVNEKQEEIGLDLSQHDESF